MIRHPSEWRELLVSHGNVRKELVPEVIREAANLAWREESPWPLVLLGEAGSGKTCAALWMLCFAKTGWFMTMGAWCHRIAQAEWATLQSSSGYKLSDTEEWSAYLNAYLAVVDDIGAREKVSDHHHSTLMQCLEVRLGKRTVLTSNLTMEELAAVYDDRIVSRLSAGTQVYVTGDQRKPQGKQVGCPLK